MTPLNSKSILIAFSFSLTILLFSSPLAQGHVEKAIDANSAFKGRTYFSPNEPVSMDVSVESSELTMPLPEPVRRSKFTRKTQSQRRPHSSSASSFGSAHLIKSTRSDSDSVTTETGPESNPTSSVDIEIPLHSRSRSRSRSDYQRPWCPGLAMTILVPKALDLIYDWNNPLTCQQFVDNYGGVSVLVGELGGPDFCSAGPVIVYSNYTINRSMSINKPIYARVQNGDVEYAAAAGPIFYPEGRVLFISVAKESAKLPQFCTN